MGRFWLRLLAVIGIIGLALWPVSPGIADPPPPKPPTDLKEAPPEPRPTDLFPKLDSALARVALSLRERPGIGIASEARAAGLELEADGTVRVVIEAEAGLGAEVEAELRRRGYGVETRFEDLVQVRVGPEALSEVAELAGVRFVRRPYEALPGAITSEGVSVIRADLWQGAGIRGQGVKVGVLDLGGFYGYQSLLGSELPGTVVARSFRADGDITGGGDRHGTAVAEIIHDVAPEAALYLANSLTDVEWRNAISWLVSQGVQVINHSAGWFYCPANGSNWYAQQVDWAYQNGVLWVNSAGNSAQSHWWGYYSDPDGDQWLNFLGGDEINDLIGYLAAGTRVSAWLCWEDLRYPYTPFYDYDLYLYTYDSWGNVISPPVCSSTERQANTRQPFEWFGCNVPYTGYYGLAVRCYSANCSPLTRLHLFVVHDFKLEYTTAARSLLPPADAVGSFTVGAVRWYDLGLEPYSSQGPTEDGRTKPDIAAPTRVSTWSYGYQAFAGTSAAAPHVAGAAALVKTAFPEWGPDYIRAFLEGRARDLGPAGKDNAYGSGALDLSLPVPLPPSNLVARAVSDAQVNLSWVDNSNNESGFAIERRVPAGAYGRIGTVGANVTVFYDTGVSPGATYYYRVQACNPSGCSGYSNEAGVTLPTPAPRPTPRLWLPLITRR